MSRKKAIVPLEYPPHNPARSILLIGEISPTTTAHMFEKITEYSQSSSDPICVVLSTEGGSVYDAFAMYDLIRTSPVPIWTYGLGCVMSAGTLVLAAGHKRMLYPNCWLMDHEASFSEASQKGSELRAAIEHNEDLTERMYVLYSKHTKQSISKLKDDFVKKTVYFSAEEALEYGFVDGIVGKK